MSHLNTKAVNDIEWTWRHRSTREAEGRVEDFEEDEGMEEVKEVATAMEA